jgi:hypothetical protein
MVFDISLDFLDHMFSKGKVDESGKQTKTKFETKSYSVDQIFIVLSILFLIIGFLFIKFRHKLRKHYIKKYGKQNNTIELKPFQPSNHTGTMYIA